MSNYIIELDFGLGWTDYPIIVSDFVKDETLHNKLKTADTTVSFSMLPDVALYNLFRASDSNIPIRITKDSAPYFTGYIRKNFDITKTQKLKPIKIECVSPSFLMKRKIGVNISYSNITVTQLLTNLLTTAGITGFTLPTIPSIIYGFNVVAGEGKTYHQYIEQILFEYGYVFYFNESGQFITYKLFPDSISTTKIFDGTNIINEIKQSKKEEEREQVNVKWTGVKSVSNTIVFSDTTNAQSGYKCYIELPPNGFLGEQTEWYAELQHPDGEILSCSSLVLDWIKDSDIQVLKFEQIGNRVLLSVKNTNNSVSKFIKKFDIIAGNAVIKKDTNTSIVIKVPATEKIENIETDYIFDKSAGDALANGLAWWYRYSDFDYTLSSNANHAIGDIAIISETGIGTNTARIIKKSTNEQTGLIKYQLEAIDEYVPDVAEGETAIPSSPIFDIPVPVVDINEAFQAVNDTILVDADDGLIVTDTTIGAGTQKTILNNHQVVQQYYDGEKLSNSIFIGSPTTKNKYQINIHDRLILDSDEPKFYKETFNLGEPVYNWNNGYGLSIYEPEMIAYNNKYYCFGRILNSPSSYYGIGLRVWDGSWCSLEELVPPFVAGSQSIVDIVQVKNRVIIIYRDPDYRYCHVVYDMDTNTLSEEYKTTSTYYISDYVPSYKVIKYGNTLLMAMNVRSPEKLDLWQLDLDTHQWTIETIISVTSGASIYDAPVINVLSDGSIVVAGMVHTDAIRIMEYIKNPITGSWNERIVAQTVSVLPAYFCFVDDENTITLIDGKGNQYVRKAEWTSYIDYGLVSEYLPTSGSLNRDEFYYDSRFTMFSYGNKLFWREGKSTVWNYYQDKKNNPSNVVVYFYRTLDGDISYQINAWDGKNYSVRIFEFKEYKIVNEEPEPTGARKLLAETHYDGNGVITFNNDVVTWGQKTSGCSLFDGYSAGIYQSGYLLQKPFGETGNLVDADLWGNSGCVLYDTGNFYVMGNNSSGQLGLGDITNRELLTLSATGVKEYRRPTSLSYDHNASRLFIKKEDYLWYGCGYATQGALGNSLTGNISTWTELGLGTTVLDLFNIGGTYGCTIAIFNSNVMVAGYNGHGQLGDSTTLNKTVFTRLDTRWNNLGYYYVLDVKGGLAYYAGTQSSVYMIVSNNGSNGIVKGCGNNDYGQLGQGNTTALSYPTPCISGVTNVKKLQVAGGGPASCYALTEDNKLYVWGYNAYGQLGVGSTTNVLTPVEITISGEVIVDVFAGANSTSYGHLNQAFLITESGKLFATGHNMYGQLGDGTLVQKTGWMNRPGIAGDQILWEDRSWAMELGLHKS